VCSKLKCFIFGVHYMNHHTHMAIETLFWLGITGKIKDVLQMLYVYFFPNYSRFPNPSGDLCVIFFLLWSFTKQICFVHTMTPKLPIWMMCSMGIKTCWIGHQMWWCMNGHLFYTQVWKIWTFEFIAFPLGWIVIVLK
jgi:hypothetical protein